MNEIWKDIEGYEGLYKICNIGNKIISYSHVLKGEYMKIQKNRDGYLVVNLSNKGEKQHRISRLKAITFIPNPENKPHVNHKYGNKENNDLPNLEWCTESENQIHAYATGLAGRNNHFIINNPARGKFGKDNHSSKRIMQMDKLGNNIKEWDSARDVYKELGIPYQSISHVCRGKKKSAGGFRWEFII